MSGSIYALRSLAVVTLLFTTACGGTRISMSSGVTTSQFTATELVARIKTVLLNDAVLGTRRIDVQVIDSAVTLTGRVASKEEEDRALSLTRGVEGVRSARSELVIKP